jgi:PAS domain S-box-containing protein
VPLHLLILEDDPLVSGAYAQLFADHEQYTVCFSETGERALKIHEATPFHFAIVDYDLAGSLNGLETVQQMKAIRPLDFLICTGNTNRDLFEQSAELQPVSFFTKPIDSMVLYRQVELFRLQFESKELRLRNLKTFEAIFETANIGICLTDIHGRFVLANPAYCRTYGYSAEELIGQEFTIVLPDELVEPLRRMHYEFLMGTTEESGGRWQVRCKDGTIKPIFVTASRIILPSGERFKATTVTDISATVAYEKKLNDLANEKELLLAELQHRVKNNFQSLSALVRLQAQGLMEGSCSVEVKEFAEQIERRLGAMARTHELLSRHSSGGQVNARELIEETIHQVLKSQASDTAHPIQLDIQCSDIMIGISEGISLCLILNEALTNSLKYAQPHRSELKLTVRLKQAEDGSGIDFYFADNGPGFSPDVLNNLTSKSLGMTIIRNLAAKLKGRIEFDGSSEGASLRLWFPHTYSGAPVVQNARF